MMQIYLDNASSVPCEKWVLERFCSLAGEYFANQESRSFHGTRSAFMVKETGKKIFSLLTQESCEEGGCLFGNTGSDVLAGAIHAAGSFLKGGVVTSSVEHASLLEALKRTSSLYAFTVHYCPVGRDGALDLDRLASLLQKEKIALAAFHHIQSESGCIQDLSAVRELLDRYSPETLFLADTIQSAGKYPLPWKDARLDLAFVSGQKIGCPGGAAVLYRKTLSGHFTSLRSSAHLPGRCIPGNILLLGEVLEKILPEMEKMLEKTGTLKELLLKEIREKKIPFLPTAGQNKTSHYILHGLTTPYQGAILTRMLAQKGISVSAGSACESESGEPSYTLKSMGIKKKDLYNALRISFWHHNTEAEILYFTDVLKQCIVKY